MGLSRHEARDARIEEWDSDRDAQKHCEQGGDRMTVRQSVSVETPAAGPSDLVVIGTALKKRQSIAN